MEVLGLAGQEVLVSLWDFYQTYLPYHLHLSSCFYYSPGYNGLELLGRMILIVYYSILVLFIFTLSFICVTAVFISGLVSLPVSYKLSKMQ